MKDKEKRQRKNLPKDYPIPTQRQKQLARLSELNKILKKKAEEEEKASDEDIGS